MPAFRYAPICQQVMRATVRNFGPSQQPPNIATDYHVPATQLLQGYTNAMYIVNYLTNVQYYNAVAFCANMKYVDVKYCDMKILPNCSLYAHSFE